MADALLRIDVDPRGIFARTFTALEQQQLPFAVMQAANNTAFAIRDAWARKSAQVFDRPTPLTQKAVLYTKATKQNLASTVFLRDEIFKGNPPAKYLRAEVEGGIRAHKGFENRLIAAGILPREQFAVPAKGAPLDAFGNIPGSQINAILSQLGARFDPLQNETDVSRGKRRRREARQKQQYGGYVAITNQPGRFPAGIYQIGLTGSARALRGILMFVRQPSYHVRYDIFGLAKGVYEQQFPFQFERELGKAVQNAVIKGRA